MITTLFVRRPILASVLSLVIVFCGAVAAVNLPITQYPEITPVQVTVSATYPGADALTVANSVASPIETEINGADGLIYMNSTSANTGQMSLTAFFELGTDPDTAEVQVNNRVNLALPSLPEAVRSTGVRVQKRSSSTLMLIGLFSPDGSFDEQYIGNYANLYILDELKRVDGANQAQIMGLPDLAMRIWLDPDKMAGLGITADEVKAAIAKQNQQFGAGTIGQEPMNGSIELSVPVVTQGRYSEPEEFENIIVRAETDGTAVVRVGDVARAEVGIQQYLLRSTLNGKPGTFIAVYQQPGSNALAVATKVRTLMEDLKKSFPKGIDYEVSYDTTKFVEASIHEVVVTLVIAIILVVAVTYLFLQSVRATLIPTVAILISVVGTFAGMLMLDFSLNLLTLFGLVLAIGLVCDDAIVVVENVERNMEELKLDAKEATIRAMGEVIGPVIATTLVLIAVFVPTAFLGGTTGVLYQQFAVTLAVSVGISSFVALTMTPALCGVLLKPRTGVIGPFRVFNTALDKCTTAYAAGVKLMIKLSVVGVLLVVFMLYGTVHLFKIIPTSFVPMEDQGVLLAAVILPDGASLDRADKMTQAAADIFAEHPAVQFTSALSGFSMIDGQFKTNSGTVFIALKDFEQRTSDDMSADAVITYAAPRLSNLHDGIAIPIKPPAIPGLGTQGGFEYWVQNRGSDDPLYLAEAVQKLLAETRKRPDLARVSSTYNASSRQLEVTVDRARAETMGMSVNSIYEAMESLFGSSYVSQYDKYGRVWNVIVQADAQYRDDPEDFNHVYVRQREGQLLPLSAVIDANYKAGPDLVMRFNGFPAAKITGDAAHGYSSGQAILAMEELGNTSLPDGMSYGWSGQAFEEKQAGSTAVVAFIFGLILVFLILAGQYEKWTLPIAILTAVPFGIFGALVAVWLRGMESDVYFQVGLVTLIGLSTKNSILIVEFAQIKFAEGLSAKEAAIEAAKLRLRPILMTALSFILGAMPLVLATGAGANARNSIGTGVIGGMIAATSLALFFVPMFYFLIIGFSSWSTGRKTQKAVAAEPATDTEASDNATQKEAGDA